MMDAADLGAAICDLAEVTSTLMELFETEQAGVAKREITAATAAEHVKNWQSSSSFAVYHLRSTMARDLRKAYYAGPTWTSETVRRFTPGAVTKLVEELKPFVDAQYRTLPGAEHNGLGGSSLGGLVTLYLGLRYPSVFSRLAVMASTHSPPARTAWRSSSDA